MINWLYEFVILNGIEALFTILICLGFNLKQYGMKNIFSTWLVLTIIVYATPLLIKLPIIPQIYMLVASAYYISKMYDKSFKDMIKRMLVLIFVIMLISEVGFHKITLIIFNIDFYEIKDYIQRAILIIPVRMLQMLLIYLYLKLEVDNNEKDGEILVSIKHRS